MAIDLTWFIMAANQVVTALPLFLFVNVFQFVLLLQLCLEETKSDRHCTAPESGLR